MINFIIHNYDYINRTGMKGNFFTFEGLFVTVNEGSKVHSVLKFKLYS